MRLKPLFVNDSEDRFRSGWRIVVTVMAMMITFLPIQWALKLVLPGSWAKSQKIDFLLAVFSLVATLVIVYSRKFIDKRPVESLGFSDRRWALKDVVAGYAISGVLVAIIVIVETGFGWVTISVTRGGLSLLTHIVSLFVVSGLAVAWWENLFFVSYLFLNLSDGCGFWCSVALNCVTFGIIHSLNPNASVFSFLGIILIHSYEIFGFLRTRTLWLILGIHAGWNFFQGLAGFPVSGRTGIQIITQTNNTPAWIGGGEFGPEAGALIVPTGIAAYVLITIYTNVTRKYAISWLKDWVQR
jgi:membrane protease YdiL (CAAX protease family)